MSEIQLPSHWETVKLGEIAHITSGGTPSRNKLEYWNGDIPWVKTGEINYGIISSTEEKITHEGLNNSSAKIIPANTLLMAMYGQGVTRGRVAILGIDAAINQACAAISIKNGNSNTLTNFLFYFFYYSYKKIRNLGHGANQKNLNSAFIKSIEVYLPSLPEQKTIAHNLRTIQKAKETRQRELELERERKAALMQYLFTHGTGNEPRKHTEIGEIPESWQVVKLENLLREPLKNGHSALATNSQEGIRTLTLTAVTKNNFSIENTKLTQANPDKVKNLWLEAGDILIERANTYEMVGLAALYEGDKNFAIYPDLMIRIRVKEKEIYTKFLVEFLLTPVCRAYFKKNASGTASSMPKIDQGAIRRINIPLPLYQEQREIVEIAKNCDRKISSLEKEITLIDELFHAMLEQLMTGKISTQPLTETYV